MTKEQVNEQLVRAFRILQSDGVGLTMYQQLFIHGMINNMEEKTK